MKMIYMRDGVDMKVVEARETKAQWVVGSDRFRRDTGDKIGGGGLWGYCHFYRVEPWTAEREMAIQKRRERIASIARITSYKWSRVPDEVIAKVLAIIDDREKAKASA